MGGGRKGDRGEEKGREKVVMERERSLEWREEERGERERGEGRAEEGRGYKPSDLVSTPQVPQES